LLQILIQGRGGQGAQTAGNLLATAFFAAGREVQAFSSYGGARRGTPVSSYLRVDDRPIRLRCDIERADAILCFDSTLLDVRLLAAAHSDTLIVVNSAQSPGHFEQALSGHRVVPVDGLSISRRHGLGRIVNSALLGPRHRSAGTGCPRAHADRRGAEAGRGEHRRLRGRLSLRRCAAERPSP